jgi:hypothetical protein
MTTATRIALIAAAAVVVLAVGGMALYMWGLTEAAALSGAAALAIGGAGGVGGRSAARREVERQEQDAADAIGEADAEAVARRDAAIRGASPRERNAALIEEARRRRG